MEGYFLLTTLLQSVLVILIIRKGLLIYWMPAETMSFRGRKYVKVFINYLAILKAYLPIKKQFYLILSHLCLNIWYIVFGHK